MKTRQTVDDQEIAILVRDMNCCSTGESLSNIFGKILLLVAVVVTFSNAYFQLPVISYIGGTVTAAGLSLMQLSTFCYKAAEEKRAALNVLLQEDGEKPLPDIISPPPTTTTTAATERTSLLPA